MLTSGEELSPLAQALLIDVLIHGPQSRLRLADRHEISAATVTRLVRPLLEQGRLVETELISTGGRGRAAFALDVPQGEHRFIGIKLTSNAAYAVLTDLRANVVVRVSRTLESHDTAHVMARIVELVHLLRSESIMDVGAVGLTVGGVVQGRKVVDSPFMDWRDLDVCEMVEEAIGLPTSLDNDVAALTKVVHWFGEGKDYADFALLTIGAGLGYGLVLGHRHIPTRIPIRHLPVNHTGPLCYRGHRGCASSYLTADSVAANASAVLRRPTTFEQALKLAEGGDPAAVTVVREAAYALGQTASVVSVLTGVSRIILSGEGVHMAEIAPEALHEGLTAYDPYWVEGRDVIVRTMGFDEWARGAATVAIAAFLRL